MSKRSRRKEQPNVQGTKRNTYNRDVESKKLEQNLEQYFKDREADPTSKIGCPLCNHALFDHDEYGCLNCWTSASCNAKELIICIGNWKITLSENNIQAVLIEKRGIKNGNG